MSDTIEDPPTEETEPLPEAEPVEEPVVEEPEAVVEEPEPVVDEPASEAVEEPASEAVTEPVPVEQVASDIREILSTSVDGVTSESQEVTYEQWLAAGKRRRPDGTWRVFPEMV